MMVKQEALDDMADAEYIEPVTKSAKRKRATANNSPSIPSNTQFIMSMKRDPEATEQEMVLLEDIKETVALYSQISKALTFIDKEYTDNAAGKMVNPDKLYLKLRETVALYEQIESSASRVNPIDTAKLLMGHFEQQNKKLVEVATRNKLPIIKLEDDTELPSTMAPATAQAARSTSAATTPAATPAAQISASSNTAKPAGPAKSAKPTKAAPTIAKQAKTNSATKAKPAAKQAKKK